MNRNALNFWVDVVSLLDLLGLVVTGGLIHFVLPAGSGRWATLFGWSRHDYGGLHFYLAAAAVAILAFHVALHWQWVCCFVAKSVHRAEPSPRARTLWGVAVFLTVLGGAAAALWAASFLVVGQGEARTFGEQHQESGEERGRPARPRSRPRP